MCRSEDHDVLSNFIFYLGTSNGSYLGTSNGSYPGTSSTNDSFFGDSLENTATMGVQQRSLVWVKSCIIHIFTSRSSIFKTRAGAESGVTW